MYSRHAMHRWNILFSCSAPFFYSRTAHWTKTPGAIVQTVIAVRAKRHCVFFEFQNPLCINRLSIVQTLVCRNRIIYDKLLGPFSPYDVRHRAHPLRGDPRCVLNHAHDLFHFIFHVRVTFAAQNFRHVLPDSPKQLFRVGKLFHLNFSQLSAHIPCKQTSYPG